MSPKIEGGVTLPEHHIRIDLEGLDDENGHIRVSDFTKTIERVVNMITRLDRLAAKSFAADGR